MSTSPTPSLLSRPPRIKGLSEIAAGYDAVLCDVWGVLHNGIRIYSNAAKALGEFKKTGKPVLLLTNAPRPGSEVLAQLRKLGIDPKMTFDTIITSGDVARQTIAILKQPVFHIGEKRDQSLFREINVELAGWQNASAVVCTGLHDDLRETPDDYDQLLDNLKSRDLPFFCVNADIMVRYGNTIRWCAGALARKYEKIGGRTTIMGKPHQSVYEHAHALLDAFAGKTLDKSAILAIGDGVDTDIVGARNYGLDSIYISSGIHWSDYGDTDKPDEEKLWNFFRDHHCAPMAWTPELKW